MFKKKIVIGVSGNIGAGKGTVCDYLVKKYGAIHLTYSNVILNNILDILYLEHNRKNLATLAQGLRDMFGGSILSRALEGHIQNKEAKLIVFDGMRKKAEVDYFREKISDFVFIFVDVPMEIAYKRLIRRNEKSDDSIKTFEQFKEDHLLPADKDVPALKQIADFVIDNSGELVKTYQQIDEMMEDVK